MTGGAVAERTNAPVLKTDDLHGSEGSNPSRSAQIRQMCQVPTRSQFVGLPANEDSSGDDGLMELRPGIEVDDRLFREFARRHSIIKVAAFGSVLRRDFGPSSDIDLLVEFEPDRVPGLLTIAGMELELEQLLGRPVDLRTYGDLSRYFRDQVRATAQELYAA